MTFDLFPWRFRFVAREALHFPAPSAANVIRGALGKAFHDGAGGHYADLFAPAGPKTAPSGLGTPPRPFVLRASHLDGVTVLGAGEFYVDLHVFEVRRPTLPIFVEAFRAVAHAGLGPGRGRAELLDVLQVGSNKEPGAPLSIPLDPPSEPVNGLRIRFVTPTELKSDGMQQAPSNFRTLFCRARDRVSTLRALYGPGPLDIDFAAMAEEASVVRTVSSELHYVDVHRRSAASAQEHPLGGFTGEAYYAGPLTAFVPILEAATWTGVGRQTVWGKGAIEISPWTPHTPVP